MLSIENWRSRLTEDTVFLCSDPAGARAIHAIASFLPGTSSHARIYSDTNYSLTEFPFEGAILDDSGVERVLESRPSMVVTGTSHPSSFEKKAHRICKEHGIPCIAFIDHWVNYQERFAYEGTVCLPDEIWVMDAQAKAQAIRAGLPESKLEITGNPYHRFLQAWQPRFSREAMFLPDQVDGPYILYAPDPLSLLSDEACPGFNEIDALGLLAAAEPLEELSKYILVRPHPRQPLPPLVSSLSTFRSDRVRLSVGVDLPHLIHYADAVVSHFSNILVEAKILGASVYQYVPVGGGGNLLTHLDGLEKLKCPQDVWDLTNKEGS